MLLTVGHKWDMNHSLQRELQHCEEKGTEEGAVLTRWD